MICTIMPFCLKTEGHFYLLVLWFSSFNNMFCRYYCFMILMIFWRRNMDRPPENLRIDFVKLFQLSLFCKERRKNEKVIFNHSNAFVSYVS